MDYVVLTFKAIRKEKGEICEIYPYIFKADDNSWQIIKKDYAMTFIDKHYADLDLKYPVVVDANLVGLASDKETKIKEEVCNILN